VTTSRNPGRQEPASPVGVDVFDRVESIILLRRRLLPGAGADPADLVQLLPPAARPLGTAARNPLAFTVLIRLLH